ncbi:hypothetical protein LAV33_16895 [Bacillus safensis]|uniref:hypothetical protein n=1 Tax=Bacillus safensis TaxID=561879 RepID=UPI00163D1415|nr:MULTISPECIES: hypothetical protein [Bacillus]MEB2271950.1 hypothetical protein [Bacillus safensis]
MRLCFIWNQEKAVTSVNVIIHPHGTGIKSPEAAVLKKETSFKRSLTSTFIILPLSLLSLSPSK